MKVVLDTNVLISAILFRGSLSRLVDEWKSGAIVPVMCRESFTEFIRVLKYPKFALTEQDVQWVIEDLILPYVSVVDIGTGETSGGPCRDVSDSVFLQCAAQSNASFLVSGDDDLLILNNWEGVPIIRPSDILKTLESRSES